MKEYVFVMTKRSSNSKKSFCLKLSKDDKNIFIFSVKFGFNKKPIFDKDFDTEFDNILNIGERREPF